MFGGVVYAITGLGCPAGWIVAGRLLGLRASVVQEAIHQPYEKSVPAPLRDE